MKDWPIIIAQTDPLSGGAGWVGAGLLGLVLLWLLMRHLPEQARQVERMVAAHETTMGAAMASQRVDFLASMLQERQDFREALERIQAHCDRNSAQLAAAIDKDAQLTRQLILESRQRHDEGKQR